MDPYYAMKAWELRGLLGRGEVKAAEVLDSVLARTEEVEKRVHAFITPTPEGARAATADGAAGGAAGIPMAVKDVLCTRGVRTTCGSRMLEAYVPVYDAAVIERLRGEGLVMVGKTNTDEFAMGSSTESSAYGPTRNPWDLERVPGGSSGGSAAAVAAGEAIWALGSDSGGSVRQPACFCGLVGMKPTYGLISRYGLTGLASSLDQVGTITRDVRDCALLLSLLAGHDPRDSTSLDVEAPDYLEEMRGGIEGMRVGVPRELMRGGGLTDGVRKAVEACLGRFARLGAEVEEAGLPNLEYALSAFGVIAAAEASSNLARFDGVRYGMRAREAGDVAEMYVRTRSAGFGPEVKRRILLGTHVLSAAHYEAYYRQAQKVRSLIVRDFQAAWERFDVLVGPTSPTPAFRLGEKTQDPSAMYLADACTVPANLAGIPAISIPCGMEDGLPLGLQIMGKALGEAALLRAARAMEGAIAFAAAPGKEKGVGA